MLGELHRRDVEKRSPMQDQALKLLTSIWRGAKAIDREFNAAINTAEWQWRLESRRNRLRSRQREPPSVARDRRSEIGGYYMRRGRRGC